jgi:prepilin-type processing-associated H-X9-DG protein
MTTGSPFRTGRTAALAGLLAAAVAAVGLVPTDRPASAQAPAAGALPPELQFVPPDAALFVHADAAKLWDSSIIKSVRTADAKGLEQFTAAAKEMFGFTPDQIRTVTVFIPRLKGPEDSESAAVVVTFKAPFDKAKLQAGFKKEFEARTPTPATLHVLSDTSAAALFGLKEEFLKPRRAGENGPLTAAIREAASGKHALVAGTTLANLPDQIRADDVPAFFRSFQPIVKAESVTAVVDLDKELTAEVRVKAGTPAQAVECEKALGLLASLAQEGLGQVLKEVSKDDKDPLTRDMVAIMKALEGGLKGAKFATERNETRASIKVPGDLPFGSAFIGAKVKVQGAAARAQSQNNLKQIGLAMHNYHDINGAFPPAAVCDKTGKPMLSWRVLILPYVEADDLYKQFKLDEPWDSEHNKKLLAKMPKVYSLPSQAAGATDTHYRVFVGNGAVFDYVRGSKLQEVTDGTSNTIMVATAAEAVPWTKPDELPFDPEKDMVKLLGAQPGGEAGGNVCNTAFCDGSVRAISRSIDRKTLNALITKAGGEIIQDIP